MRPASEVERRRLNDLFAELCAIPSPSGREGAVAQRVAAELRALRFDVEEDDAGAMVGSDSGNLLARIAPRAGDGAGVPWVLLCAHLDTVTHATPIVPVVTDAGWESAGETILGADASAAVAVLLALAHRVAIEGTPVGLELLFTVGDERALAGARAFDAARIRARTAFALDHPGAVGDIVMAAPGAFGIDARFRGASAHSGVAPERGRSAIAAAARAIASMRLGRLDDDTVANVATIVGGDGQFATVPEHCTVTAEVRSLDPDHLDAVVAEIVDRCYDAANDPACECDVDLDAARRYDGYRHTGTATGVGVAEAALRVCGYEPRRVTSTAASTANVLQAAGIACVALGNGVERPHEPAERISQVALGGMFDVLLALVDELAVAGVAPGEPVGAAHAEGTV